MVSSDGRRARGPSADHDLRRAEIVEAVVQLASTGGLDAVNVRDVAATAGMSLGRVQHYFPTKSNLIAAAFWRVSNAGTVRIQQRLAQLPSNASVLRSLLALLADELIPTDPARRREMNVAFAFTARALVDPVLAGQLRDGYGNLHALVTQLLQEGIDNGEIAPGIAPAPEADRYLALLEGLGAHVLLGHRDADAARALAAAAVAGLFTD